MAENKITTIRFNAQELRIIDEMSDYLGLSSRSATIKACLPYAKQRIDQFLAQFANVIQPLKKSEIDTLVTTMSIIAKQVKDGKRQLNTP